METLKNKLRALWTTRKPLIAVFGPSVVDTGYCISDCDGCTFQDKDCCLPDFNMVNEYDNDYDRPDHPRRMKALKKIAVKKLQPGDLALVRINERHAHGYYGYVVLPKNETISLDTIFSKGDFEQIGSMPIVPYDLLTPLLKEAIMEMSYDYNDCIGRGFGFEYKNTDTKSWIHLGKTARFCVKREKGNLPRILTYNNTIFNTWTECRPDNDPEMQLAIQEYKNEMNELLP